jgi:hypothetical protein
MVAGNFAPEATPLDEITNGAIRVGSEAMPPGQQRR